MKKTYIIPVVNEVQVVLPNHLLQSSFRLSGNAATTEDGTYKTLSRRRGYTWDDDEDEDF